MSRVLGLALIYLAVTNSTPADLGKSIAGCFDAGVKSSGEALEAMSLAAKSQINSLKSPDKAKGGTQKQVDRLVNAFTNSIPSEAVLSADSRSGRASQPQFIAVKSKSKPSAGFIN